MDTLLYRLLNTSEDDLESFDFLDIGKIPRIPIREPRHRGDVKKKAHKLKVVEPNRKKQLGARQLKKAA